MACERVDGARKRNPEVAENVLHEPVAAEARRRAVAVAVGNDSNELHAEVNNGCAAVGLRGRVEGNEAVDDCGSRRCGN